MVSTLSKMFGLEDTFQTCSIFQQRIKCSPQILPTSASPENMIFAYWGALNISAAYTTFYEVHAHRGFLFFGEL